MAGHPDPGHDEPTGPPQAPGALRLDGRLDLDHLDVPADLDLLDDGHDSPLLEERLRAALADAGLTAWGSRHRRALTAGAVAAVVLLVSGVVWSSTRPAPLPEQPHVLVRASGAGPAAYVVPDPESGAPVSVVQSLSLTSAERPGVRVEVVGVEGPGLLPEADGRPVAADDADDTEQHASAGGRLDCTTPEATTRVVGAAPADYRVLLRRTAPEGESRVDGIRFVGVQVLRQLVLASCMQLAAVRDLRVASVSAAPVPGVVAADVDVMLGNDSPRVWLGLRVPAVETPVLVSAGRSADLRPGTADHVRLRLWPQDCAHPTAGLDAGLPLQVGLGSEGQPVRSAGMPSFRLPLPSTAVETVSRAFDGTCRGPAPGLVLNDALVATTGLGPSAGEIDLTVTVRAPGSASLTADPEGALTYGALVAPRGPVPLVDGTALLALRWRLPTCEQVVQDGPLRLALTLPGDPPRPYRPEVHGDALRAALATLCGTQVAAVAA